MQLSPQMLSRVASLLAPLPFVERRGEPRTSVRGTARIMRGTPTDGAPPRRSSARPVTVYVQDLSAGGAGMLSAAPVEPGEQFVLVMEKTGWDGSAGGEGLSILCAAAYCRSLARDLYGIGVQFLHPTAAPEDGASDGATARDLAALAGPEEDAPTVA